MPYSSDSSTPDFPIPEPDAAKKLAAITHYQLGNDLLAANKYDLAKSAYQYANECDPTLAIAHSGLAIVCYHLGEYTAALVAIDLAIDLTPKGIDYYHQRNLIVRSLNS